MKKLGSALLVASLLPIAALTLTACSSMSSESTNSHYDSSSYAYASYSQRSYSAPSTIASKEKTIMVDPNIHTWGAYENGQLVKSGLATAGSSWCPDIGRPCKTRAGSFRIQSLGSASCKSSIYPLPRGGAPMPLLYVLQWKSRTTWFT